MEQPASDQAGQAEIGGRGGPSAQDPLTPLAAMVVKTGLCLGGLSDAQRQSALSLAAAALPLGQVASEPVVNAALKAFLADAGRFLDTDHVELRRWLVDSGWWQRDGFGRAYERVARPALAADQQALHDSVAGLENTASWAKAQREAAQARRDLRRAAWQAQGRAGSQA